MRKLCMGWLLALGGLTIHAAAADYYLDNVKGDDRNDGSANAPAATFAVLQPKLKPGDTVHLNPTGKIYRQNLVINRVGGTAEAPITIDGHDQTVSGADPVPADAWKPVADGVFAVENLPARVALLLGNERGAVRLEQLDRDSLEPGEWCWDADDKLFYFMPAKGQKLDGLKFEATLVDDSAVTLEPAKLERSHSKIGALRHRNLKEVKALKVDGAEAKRGWAKERLAPGAWTRVDKGVYFRPPAGFDFAKTPVEAMVRENCFTLHGAGSFIHIKNVNGERCFNDAYNLHGNLKGVFLDRANARQCGDEGISGHETCEFTYQNAVIRECDNGMNHVQDAKSVTKNVYIADSRANGVEFQLGAKAVHQLENIVVVDNAFNLTWGGSPDASVTVRNVLSVSHKPATDNRFGGGKTVLENLTVVAPKLKFISHGLPMTLKNATFAVPKLEIDCRKRPLDFLTLDGVKVPEGTELTNGGQSREPILKAGLAGLGAVTLKEPFDAAAAAKEFAPAELFAIYEKNR